MAIDGIGLSEPSTITKSLAAVPITRNSSVTYQEVMVLGSPNSTTATALAEVLGTAPPSTVVGLAVRIVSGPSTATDLPVRALLPSTAGDNRVTVYQSTGSDLRATIYQSTASDLNVTVANLSTTQQISSVGGVVAVRLQDSSAVGINASTSAPATGDNGLIVRQVGYSTVVSVSTGSVRVHQSSAADLNVTVAGYVAPSTVVSVSTGSVRVHQSTATDLSAQVQPIAGSTWRVQPGSTLWASSAGFHFDSSGAMQVNVVAGTISASTGVTVNRIVGNSSAADAVPVRIVLADGSTYVTPAIDYTHSAAVTASTVTGPAVLLYASSAAPSSVTDGDMVLQWGTQHGAANVALVTSSGASMADSTNTALRVNVVAGSAAGSTITTVSTGSVRVHQSTASDLQATVTPVAGSTWRVQPGSTLWASSAGFHFDSSGALLISGASNSTQVAVSSIAGRVAIAGFNTADGIFSMGDSTNNALRVNVVAGAAGGSTEITVRQSTVGDLRVAAYQSTVGDLLATVNNRDGSGNALESAASQPSTSARGLIVRPVIGGLANFAVSTAFNNSTALTIASSNAVSKAYVYAISVMSTVTTQINGGFYDGGTLKWPFVLSSGFGGFNLAVSPPAYLFSGSTGSSLTINTGGSTVAGGVNVAVAYWVST